MLMTVLGPRPKEIIKDRGKISPLRKTQLILFDKKVVFLLFVCVFSFFILVFLKIHTSSMSIWSQILPNEGKQNDGLMIGAPRGVRSDEWVVSTPYSLSQSANKFKLENDNLGAGRPTLLTNVPVSHISTIFRPQFWGYFLFDVERGLSFFWLFKYFALFVSFFLFLMLLTRNNFLLSVIGSLWLLLSSFIQWWFSTTIPEMLASFFFMFIGLVYLLRSKRFPSIFVGAVLFSFSAINFALCLYPPFQILLIYLFAVLVLGYFLSESAFYDLKENLKVKVAMIIGSLSLIGFVLFRFYIDVRGTIEATLNTVYPGKRRSLGGGMTSNRYFVGFYNFLMSENKFPPQILPNMSESSAFVMFYPLALISLAVNFIKKRKSDLLLMLVIIYILVISFYTFIPFPNLISKITFFNLVPTQRTILGFGLANIIACILYLNTKKEGDNRYDMTITALAFFAVLFFGLVFREYSGYFLRYREIFFVAIVVAFSLYFMVKRNILGFAATLIPLVFLSGMIVNPITAGLGSIYKKDISIFMNEKGLNSRENLWAVYGDRLSPNFFIASGVRVFDGVKYTPDLSKMSILDPEKKYIGIYNRYAHIAMKEPEEEMWGPFFKLNHDDNYTIYVKPCSEKLKEVGITHYIFNYKADTINNSCLTLINEKSVNGLWLYKRNN